MVRDIRTGSRAIPPGLRPLRTNWDVLSKALATGDLGAARTAFDALHARPQNGTDLPAADQISQISVDFQSLGSALQSGDLGLARNAFGALLAGFQALSMIHDTTEDEARKPPLAAPYNVRAPLKG